MFVDTHCHLQDDKYKDIENIVKNAVQANTKRIIISGYDEESNIRAIEIAQKYEEVYATVGYQPLEIKHINDDDLKKLEKLVNKPKVVAIGEIGLDFYYDNQNYEKQTDMFIKQIELANKYKKSIVVHSRDSIEETYNILEKYKNKNIKGIVHCYSSSVEMAHKLSKLNMYFGIGGVVTYKNAKILKNVVDEISLTRMVLETDAPYLSPEPKRGKINEPANIVYIAQKIAEIKDISVEEVMVQTTKNAIEIFDKIV